MNPKRLFLASQIALIVTAMSFALRTTSTASWVLQFNESNERNNIVPVTHHQNIPPIGIPEFPMYAGIIVMVAIFIMFISVRKKKMKK